jgi:hypothetical protein
MLAADSAASTVERLRGSFGGNPPRLMHEPQAVSGDQDGIGSAAFSFAVQLRSRLRI